MQQVTLYIDVNKTLEIVHELKTKGWVMGADFDFAHHRPEYDDFGHDFNFPRRTVFTFYNDVNASYFMLRWG